MLLIPAIDLKDGRCVRLKQGDMNDSTTFGEDPAAMARRWLDAGARRLHLVDLNGADGLAAMYGALADSPLYTVRFAAVPEVGTLGLAGVGLAVLGLRRRVR